MNRWDSKRIVLGTFSASHLGDVLCISPLPRLLTQFRGLHVYVSRQPHVQEVFQNNPYVIGIAEGSTVNPNALATGDGHVMQRIFQGFNLPLGVPPKPEVYLTYEERTWAMRERSKWPADRPICILSCGAVSDRGNTERVNWLRIGKTLAQRYTVIQPILHERPVPEAIDYTGLTPRQYFSLFTVADCFVGGTSGGSHLAAAFDVPALIVIWRSMEQSLQFPTSNHGFKATFLYPHHWFIAAEDVAWGGFQKDVLASRLDQLAAHGRKGRPTAINNSPRNPWGFAPKPSSLITQTASGRFVRLPTEYSGHGPNDR